jgi:hypothetical protein
LGETFERVQHRDVVIGQDRMELRVDQAVIHLHRGERRKIKTREIPRKVERKQHHAGDAARPQDRTKPRVGERGFAKPEKLGVETERLRPALGPRDDLPMKEHEIGPSVFSRVHQRQVAAIMLVTRAPDGRERGAEQGIRLIARGLSRSASETVATETRNCRARLRIVGVFDIDSNR